MDAANDLPFYDGRPVDIGGRGWLIVIASVAVAFALLIATPLSGVPFGFVPPILFTVVPLAALAWVAGPSWTALFRPYGLKQVGLSVLFAFLTLAASLAAGLVLSTFAHLSPNPSIGAQANTGEFLTLLARAFIQLIGEEAVTILPLLAVLWLCVTRFGLSRRVGLTIAVLVSTVWFAAMHLPTYNWNVLQCLGAIGTARLVLTASYLLTRNMAVSIGAHILNDWTEFFVAFAGSHGPIAGSAG